jgi:hypothetical protein
MIIIILFILLFFYSGREISHPEILFCFTHYTVIMHAAPQETVGEAGIESGTVAWQPGIS